MECIFPYISYSPGLEELHFPVEVRAETVVADCFGIGLIYGSHMTHGRSQDPRVPLKPRQGYISDPFPGLPVSFFKLLSPFLMLSVCLCPDCSEM